MAEPIDTLAGGVADRLRTLLLALDRHDRLETAQAFVGWLGSRSASGELAADARELLLRALRLAGDPINYGILRSLDPLEATELATLMERTGLERVAASERVHDLVQVGLAVREMIGDQIRSTALGGGLVALVDAVSTATGDRLAAERGDAPAEAGSGGG